MTLLNISVILSQELVGDKCCSSPELWRTNENVVQVCIVITSEQCVIIKLVDKMCISYTLVQSILKWIEETVALWIITLRLLTPPSQCRSWWWRHQFQVTHTGCIWDSRLGSNAIVLCLLEKFNRMWQQATKSYQNRATRSASRNGRTMGVSMNKLNASVVMKVLYISFLLKIMTMFLELLGLSIFSYKMIFSEITTVLRKPIKSFWK